MDDVGACFPWLWYHTDYRTLICRRCQHGIRHPGLAAHLRDFHKDLDSSQRQQIVRFYQSQSLIASDVFRPPPQPIHRLRSVQFFLDGLKCTKDGCSYICRSKTSIKRHAEDQHQWENPYTRGGSLRQRRNAIYPWQTNILCQRLFLSGKGQGYFEILPDTNAETDAYDPSRTEGNGDTDKTGAKDDANMGGEIEINTRERILGQLDTFESERAQNTTVQMGNETEANPWLRKTGWDEHLQGHQLEDLAPLVDLPLPNEPILEEFGASIDRTIEEARQSVLAQRINIFDQTLVNMFNDHQTKAGQPLSTKLQDGTYARYKTVWKKLLCFVYRLRSSSSSKFNLPYQLTHMQKVAFDRSVRVAGEITKHAGYQADGIDEVKKRLDIILLRFSIALLDHHLRGSIYDSFLVGFLAVLGIDRENVRCPRNFSAPANKA